MHMFGSCIEVFKISKCFFVVSDFGCVSLKQSRCESARFSCDHLLAGLVGDPGAWGHVWCFWRGLQPWDLAGDLARIAGGNHTMCSKKSGGCTPLFVFFWFFCPIHIDSSFDPGKTK